MSLLDNASLVLTPNAYKEGKLYSVIPSNGNGDFTATRATTATRVNSDGLVELVPYNLLQRSEEFNVAPWLGSFGGTGTAPIITANYSTAPNGTLTAERVQLSRGGGVASTDFSSLFQGGLTLNATGTASIYLKSNTASNQNVVFYWALGQGQVVVVTPEWQRFTLNILTTGTSGIVIGTRGGASYFSGGDDTLDISVWGAQVVEGTSARDYLRTETRLNIPRVDYSLGGCPNILLEPQRTNLALQSSSFDSASWAKFGASITANSTTSPSGIVDADTLTADGTNILHRAESNLNVTNATTYSWSVYAKKNTNNFIQLSGTNGGFGSVVFANFDLNSGLVGSVGAGTTASIQNVGNGWYRCAVNMTAIATTSVAAQIIVVTSATAARKEENTLSTSVFLWGAQLEAGAYATSYIPTTTASVTRNADSITRNNIFTNGLITASGGTWFVELRNVRALTRDAIGNGILIGSTTNGLSIRNGSGASLPAIFKYISGGATQILGTISSGTSKIAFKWNGSTADVFLNGVKVVSATAFAITNMDSLSAATIDVPAYLNEMILYPTPLTDAQCLALTA